VAAAWPSRPRRTVIWPLNVDLRSFHGNVFPFVRRYYRQTVIWPLNVDLRSFHGNVFPFVRRYYRQTRSTLTNFRLHRDGSACGCLLSLNWQGTQGAPNSYTGSGPLCHCLVRERRPSLRSRPRNLSVPNAVSSKRRDRPPRGVTVPVRTITVGIETHGCRAIAVASRRRSTRIGATGLDAASSQLVFGSACGPPKRAMVQRVRMSGCTGPRRGGQSNQAGSGLRRIGPSGLIGIESHSFVACCAFALAAPVRQTAPRAGPESPGRRERAESSRPALDSRVKDPSVASSSPSSVRFRSNINKS
jgi:hypothetical protein